MSDFTAFYISSAFAIAFAPWYVVVMLLLALVVFVAMEMP